MPTDDPPACDPRPGPDDRPCDDPAAFWLYDRDAGRWRPVCERHARTAHPSLEVKAWLESGYARPVERGRPGGPPAAPAGGRGSAFRTLVDETMGWAE